ncbi:hypothetical protein [Actinomycetospora soli]|uniref:hypothetical protein n=1 Tax=Actinomycetospora soli TaxID=2893887 RepID=UPI001E530C12|nr:hypothetical protein [Actinomycetospora soli]MCD2191118.1 hypothetical protein [Actinomycetospora soli]
MVLPFVEGFGVASWSVLEIPYIGTPTMLVLVLLTLLPTTDVLQGRIRWTGLLLLPAIVGLLPIGATFLAVSFISAFFRWLLGKEAPDIVDIGIAGATFAAVDGALLVLAVSAILVQIRTHIRCSPRASRSPRQLPC